MSRFGRESTAKCRLLLAFALVCASAGPLLEAKNLERADAIQPVGENEIIPVIDFFRSPTIRGASLNSAGTKFAAITGGIGDHSTLLVYDLATNRSKRVGDSDLDIGDFRWLNAHRLLFQAVSDKHYSYGLYTADADDLGRMAALDRYDVLIPISAPKNDPLKPYVWMRQYAETNGKDGGVFQVDAKGMSNFDRDHKIPTLRVFQNPKGGVPVGYFPDSVGELAFAISLDEGILSLHRLGENGWARCPVDLDAMNVVGASDKAGEIIVRVRDEPKKPIALRRLNALSGQLGEVLYRDNQYDPVDVSFYCHPLNGHILGVSFSRRGRQTVWLDSSYAQLQTTLNAALPNEVVTIVGSDDAQNLFFVYATSDQHPGRYYLLNRTDGKLSPLTETAPWLDAKRMRPMQVLSYKSRDGISIEGYLTLPANASKENPPPLIVFPHGGPWVRDNWGWNPRVQFFASRGYAVFQPNYRGSPGFAWRFDENQDWEFRKMHEDVTDGTLALIKAGLVDSKRIAILGGSFGGYLALCGAAYEPNLYRCAVTISGVFDWEQVIRESDEKYNDFGATGLLRRRLGDPRGNKDKFDEISPLRSVETIKVPIFVAHGKDDPIANVNESKRLIRALEKNHIPYESMIKSGEGHGFSYLENNVELYTRIEAFLLKHLAPEPKSVTQVSTK